MSEKYAAEGHFEGLRHRGRHIGTLWLERNDLTGDVTLSAEFLSEELITRADVLLDILCVLQQEYNTTLLRMRGEMPSIQ